MAGNKPGRAKQDLVRFTFNLPAEKREYLDIAAERENSTLTRIIEDAIGIKQTIDVAAGETGFIDCNSPNGEVLRLVVDPGKLALFARNGGLDAPKLTTEL